MAEALLLPLVSLTALDLSNNKLDNFPRGIASSLIGLDLSYNAFVEVAVPRRLDNLIELRLRGNSITRLLVILILT